MRAEVTSLRLRIAEARKALDINTIPRIKMGQEKSSVEIEKTDKNAKLKELNDMKAKLKGFKK